MSMSQDREKCSIPASAEFVQKLQELQRLHQQEIERVRTDSRLLHHEFANGQMKGMRTTSTDCSATKDVSQTQSDVRMWEQPQMSSTGSGHHIMVQALTETQESRKEPVPGASPRSGHHIMVQALTETREPDREPASGRAESLRRHSAGSQANAEIVKEPSSTRLPTLRSHKTLMAEVERRFSSTTLAPVKHMSAIIQEFFRLPPEKARPMSCMERFFRSDAFDIVVSIVILANAVCIAIDTAQYSKGQTTPLWLDIAELVFLAAYTLELAIAIHYVGFKIALASKWVQFDIVVIAFGLIGAIYRAAAGDDRMLDAVFVVRMLRLARVARVLRIMRMFKTLWRLLHGLMQSLGTLVWTFILLFILLFAFAVSGMELIVESDERSETYNSIVRANFGDLWETCITLMQVVTLDSAGPIYRPLIAERPLLALYFLFFILLVSIALMNLVTAIMVESSLDKSAADKEVKRMWELKKKKKRVDRVQEIFVQMDVDASGKLTLSELLTAPAELKREFAELIDTEDFEMLFQLLDYDSQGAVNFKDFCDGVEKICRGKLEMFSLIYQGNAMMKKSDEMLGILRSMHRECPWFETVQTF